MSDPHDSTNERRGANRRTVLKAIPATVLGGNLVAEAASADQTERGGAHEEGVNLHVRQVVIEPGSNRPIPTRVRVPENTAVHREFPTRVFFGHLDQFSIGIDGQTEVVSLPGHPDEDVANGALATPEAVQQTTRPAESEYDMHFRIEDIDLSKAAGDEITMALAFVPRGRSATEEWDTDTVWFDLNAISVD